MVQIYTTIQLDTLPQLHTQTLKCSRVRVRCDCECKVPREWWSAWEKTVNYCWCIGVPWEYLARWVWDVGLRWEYWEWELEFTLLLVTCATSSHLHIRSQCPKTRLEIVTIGVCTSYISQHNQIHQEHRRLYYYKYIYISSEDDTGQFQPHSTRRY